eukprot:g44946.t1
MNDVPVTRFLTYKKRILVLIGEDPAGIQRHLCMFNRTKEVVMGTRMGPSYACLFIGYVEQSLFRCYTGTIPHLFLHYIDDCNGAASCPHKKLEQFINFTNTHHPNLKFTCTISDTSLSFLGLSVTISGDHLETDIYFKPIDSHSYLHYTSSPPGFTCTSVNVVHCICCSRCGLLYVSETKQRLGDCFVEQMHSVRHKQQHLPVMNNFNSPSHSLGDMSILGLLQCHNNATRKLEEQHLIFHLWSLQPNGLKPVLKSFKWEGVSSRRTSGIMQASSRVQCLTSFIDTGAIFKMPFCTLSSTISLKLPCMVAIIPLPEEMHNNVFRKSMPFSTLT